MKISKTTDRIPLKCVSPDGFVALPDGELRDCASFLINAQLTDMPLWAKFVEQFRLMPDGEDQGWRGEYWGKMMRGAAMIYASMPDGRLYEAMRFSVIDLLSVAEADGRVSSYSRDKEFDGWDLWCRKYVLLGMIYFLEVCPDDALCRQIVSFCKGVADAVLRGIGKETGKKSITRASRSWFGVNSSSILEPMVKLYRITGDARYLNFASYIVEEGGAEGINIFALARENRLLPYQYGVSKAYEMISCFEGLLEYAKVTGNKEYLIAVENFGRALLESETSIIGSLGITHELLDHTRLRQTVRYDGVMQETCVTVTWMKFCGRLYELTGDSVFADAMEISFHNAYLGSLNLEHRHSPYIREKFIERDGEPYVIDTFLAFDSYSPLTCGKRGQKVGGNRLLSDKSYYGCCACIGAAGLGAMLSGILMRDREGYILSFYEKGEYFCDELSVKLDTEYPTKGDISISLSSSADRDLPICLRIPAWAENAELTAPLDYTKDGGFFRIVLCAGEKVDLILKIDLSFRVERPITWDRDVVYTDTSASGNGWHSASAMEVFHKKEDDDFFAIMRGPLVLGADERFGRSLTTPFKLCNKESLKKSVRGSAPIRTRFCLLINDGNGDYLVGDYASLGLDWHSDIAAWLPAED